MGIDPSTLRENAQKIKDMKPEEVQRVLGHVPKRQLMRVYAKYCNDNQISDLFDGWDDAKQEDRIKALIKALRKHHGENKIPKYILEKYKY